LGLTLDEATAEDKVVTVNEIEVLLDGQVVRFADDQVIHFVQDGFTISAKDGGGCDGCGGSCH